MRSATSAITSLIIASVLVLQPSIVAASSVGPYGVHRVTMLEPAVDGRPVTFSEFDIFACIDRNGSGEIYRVPYRYVTDQTSIPSGLIGFLAGQGLNPMYSNAAIVHDYFYATGKPGNIALQKRADEDLVTLMRSERVSEGNLAKVRAAFNLVRLDLTSKNPFGAEREWSRWADPVTLTYARTGVPARQTGISPVVVLGSCHVFDSVATEPQRSALLHACLHNRYRSTLAVGFWPPLTPPRTPPLIPTPLRIHSARTAEFMAGDCTQFD